MYRIKLHFFHLNLSFLIKPFLALDRTGCVHLPLCERKLLFSVHLVVRIFVYQIFI